MALSLLHWDFLRKWRNGTTIPMLRTERIWTTRGITGRVRSLRVQGRDGEAQIGARALREALGADVIRSTLFEIRKAPEGWVFVGSGHGHGVGMSQWGAQGMARGGASYREILSAFYPGARIRQGARP